MMASTKIEWADAVWNPITGCTPISEGCDHCYAKRMAIRLAGRYGYGTLYPFSVTFHRDRLDEPLKWKKSRRVFVCSMGDLFHESIDFRGNEIRDIFRIMAASDSTFMVLTKRPQRMAECIEYLYGDDFHEQMPNVWLGVTAENQARFDERIAILIRIPAAVRWLSAEPLLGSIDLSGVLTKPAWKETPAPDGFGHELIIVPRNDLINFVVAGGETGPGARAMHPDWVRSLRDQCHAAGVPFFFKGWGEYAGLYSFPIGSGVLKLNGGFLDHDKAERPFGDSGPLAWKVGKKVSGRMLDGREWSEFPDKQ